MSNFLIEPIPNSPDLSTAEFTKAFEAWLDRTKEQYKKYVEKRFSIPMIRTEHPELSTADAQVVRYIIVDRACKRFEQELADGIEVWLGTVKITGK